MVGFSVEDMEIAPAAPRPNQPVTISGKLKLLGLPYLLPSWVIVSVTYPEEWWEEIIPIWGSPEVRRLEMAVGGNFSVTFPQGFSRAGEYNLGARLYGGPSFPIDALVAPFLPPVATLISTFAVSGPPVEVGFTLGTPSVSPATEVAPGTDIEITIPVTSMCEDEQTVVVRCTIWEGSWWPGAGTRIRTYTSTPKTINPGETFDFPFPHRTIAGTIARRDVGAEVLLAGRVVADHQWDDVYSVRPPEVGFTLGTLSVSPAREVAPGTSIEITIPVTSESTTPQTVSVRLKIWEGSWWPGAGTLIKTYTSAPKTIAPGETLDFAFPHRTIAGTIARRDVGAEVLFKGQTVADHQWDDVYSVQPAVVGFTLGTPSVSPATEVAPGTSIEITIPVTSESTTPQTVSVRLKIWEGSWWPGAGTLIKTYTSAPKTINPGETLDFAFPHRTIAGTIARRDIGAEVLVAGRVVADHQWDDVYSVTGVAPPPPEMKEITYGACSGVNFRITPTTISWIRISLRCTLAWGSSKIQLIVDDTVVLTRTGIKTGGTWDQSRDIAAWRGPISASRILIACENCNIDDIHIWYK